MVVAEAKLLLHGDHMLVEMDKIMNAGKLWLGSVA